MKDYFDALRRLDEDHRKALIVSDFRTKDGRLTAAEKSIPFAFQEALLKDSIAFGRQLIIERLITPKLRQAYEFQNKREYTAATDALYVAFLCSECMSSNTSLTWQEILAKIDEESGKIIHEIQLATRSYLQDQARRKGIEMPLPGS
jgi:hypothetical protein